MSHSSSLRSLERRAKVASAFFAANAALVLLMVFPAASAMLFPEDDVLGLGAGFGALLVVLIGSFVSFLMWVHKAATNARLLSPAHGFTFTTGWAVGWWFVPLACLWKPLQAMHEIWHVSEGPERDADGYTTRVTWGSGAPVLLSSWWGAWVCSTIVDRMVSRMESLPLALDLGAALLNFAAAALAIFVMRELTAVQRTGLERLARETSVASELGHVVGAEESRDV